ncbi:hypothetical protein VTK73DRAFT_6937 [Phialemonium thermophilum]|uniref:Uncharacterized protein n=1 Tax=Phialemonium thermophilum TaxID=223376 RepID=A0ABR3XUR3_9PEZI
MISKMARKQREEMGRGTTRYCRSARSKLSLCGELRGNQCCATVWACVGRSLHTGQGTYFTCVSHFLSSRGYLFFGRRYVPTARSHENDCSVTYICDWVGGIRSVFVAH